MAQKLKNNISQTARIKALREWLVERGYPLPKKNHRLDEMLKSNRITTINEKVR